MAKRLIKIAKELNVGTATIVDFLVENGFEIENKPTAKVSDDMIAELTKEFQGSMDIKEQADQIIIGTRPSTKPAEQPTTTPCPSVVAPPPPEVIEEPEPTPEPEPEPEPEAEPEVVETEVPKVGLTIKGKIDLEDVSKPKKKEEPKEKTTPNSNPHPHLPG